MKCETCQEPIKKGDYCANCYSKELTGKNLEVSFNEIIREVTKWNK